MMFKSKYLLSFYKFIHKSFKQPMFLNILILGIFLVSIKFWYMFLSVFSTWLKDAHNFYFLFDVIICVAWICVSAYYQEKGKHLLSLFINISVSFIVCWSITQMPCAHTAYAESTQILTQLQHYKLSLLQSRIQLKEFGSTMPHLYSSVPIR